MGGARRLTRRLALPLIGALAVFAVVVAMAVPAAAQDYPKPGLTPAVVAQAPGNILVFYTGVANDVRELVVGTGAEAAAFGGILIGPPAAAWVAPGVLSAVGFLPVFGRGTNNALWWTGPVDSYPPRWTSLGGRLTAEPGAAATAARLDVVVRGADGALWHRALTRAGWSSWSSLGGRLLDRTGPAAAFVGGTLQVAVVGTDHALWLKSSSDGVHWSGWRSLGGRVVASPAVAEPAPGAGVAFVRGADNAVWYKQFAGSTPGVTPGWHSIGGLQLTSGVSASTATDNRTYVFAQGPTNTVNLPWYACGIWPQIHGWLSWAQPCG